ncbi:hypothetical protein [Galbibacter pacificus]|uniref:Terminase small subunit n=1 Tax=Galbibacter pacificus TaxID=2996052 RepID=A0ABT6FR01_9FLAO|nr:hypothetical protein [Galbibacter pacificus]MDG3582037.1 hypothetical protein [Galbibacter pacificus]MDG3585489.1 hypothetical protein [Galbibacter pacificus]
MAYTQEQRDKILDDICQFIRKGDTLRTALSKADKGDEGNSGYSEKGISWTTFYEWIDENPKKAEQYSRAIEIRAEKMAEELLDIADATADDIITDKDGKEIINHHVVNRDKLRVDTRKWLMSKMFAKKYSDKSTHILEGGDKPLDINIDFGDD